MSRNRTVVEKVGDWHTAYQAISAELTPQALRMLLGGMNDVLGAATTPAEAIQLMQSSMALARLVSSNDRASAIAAAVITASGGATRPLLVEDQE